VVSPTGRTSISGKSHKTSHTNIVLTWCSTSLGFKSPATISQAQSTAQYNGTAGSLAARGRHDPCVVPRAIPIVEAMSAIVVLE
jgi:chorismate synthase